jgi:hypothetical protein
MSASRSLALAKSRYRLNIDSAAATQTVTLGVGGITASIIYDFQMPPLFRSVEPDPTVHECDGLHPVAARGRGHGRPF